LILEFKALAKTDKQDKDKKMAAIAAVICKLLVVINNRCKDFYLHYCFSS
jgi:hypothetical protein